MLGRQFGRLTVVRRTQDAGRGAHYLCECSCGGGCIRAGRALRAAEKHGHASGCGCTLAIAQRANGRANRTHGHGKGATRKLYDVWRQMHRRCTDPACKDYPAWGGRGISVSEEWGDVSAFVAWAQASGYREGLTIERRDNNAGYSPDNCRWIVNELQASNTRRLRSVVAFGRAQRLDEWAAETGVAYRTIIHRLKMGWPAERAVSERPARGRNQSGVPRAYRPA